MKPVRLPITNKADDTDTKSVGTSPKFFSNLFSSGRHRRPSLSGESLGCLSLLDDAEEQVERPRALPSPGLAGEILPSHSLKVHAQPTVHIHRPRAVLSSPENDELQGQQVEKLITSSSALKALEEPPKDLTTASLSSVEFNDQVSLSKEVPKAVVSPPDELIYMGDIEASTCDEASSCSTSSNMEHSELSLSHEPSNELVDIKHSRTPPEALKEKMFNAGLPPKSRHEQNGNEQYFGSGTLVNRLVKKHSGLPPNASRRSPKQSSSPLSTKGNSGRVLRPWY